MGYITLFGEQLDAMLQECDVADEASRQEVVEHVKKIVLESYKNGLAAARKESGKGKGKAATPRKK